MALESQGVQIRLAAATVTTACSSVLSISSGDTSKILSSDTAEIDFETVGFASAMRIETNSTVNDGSIFTIKSVAASVMELFEDATADAGTALHLTGKTFTAIGEVKSFSGPSGAAAVIDVSHLGSTAKEKLIGVRDEGQFTFECNFQTSAGNLHKTLRDARAARTKKTFDVLLTDSAVDGNPSALYFGGYVISVPLSGGVDAAVTQSMTLEISSNVYWIDATT